MLTVLVLLRKEANSPSLTGSYERQMPDGWMTNRYNYRVVRLWKEDPETYLKAGVSLVPLAPLTNVTEADLPGLIRRMEETIDKEPRPRAGKLWTATSVLMGLRYPKELSDQLLKGKQQAMRESLTYQAILREGRQRASSRERGGHRGRAIRRGAAVAGSSGEEAVRRSRCRYCPAIEAIKDLDRFEALGDRVLDAGIQSWDDLLRDK